MEEQTTHATSRRNFLKAAGFGMIAAAASAGAFNAANPRVAMASDALPATEKGVTDFSQTAGMYEDVFQVPMRSIPVRDVQTDLDRQGNVAFEMRDFDESEIARTEVPTCSWPARASRVSSPPCLRRMTARPRFCVLRR